MTHKFRYRWNLSDKYPAANIQYHGTTVFGTFVCGGGSTMGYKLSGFKHIGGVEIDRKIAKAYRLNHRPEFFYNDDIRVFVERTRLPSELFAVDILDGSPPCSSFSMAGNREKDWGKEKQFAEGQAEQRLDDLFFEYIKVARKLRPKVLIAENVKGMILGNARSYVRRIREGFDQAGYDVQLFLMNAASMGVPQRRERVFFVCKHKELHKPKLELRFDEPPITLRDVENTVDNPLGRPVTESFRRLWEKTENGKPLSTVHPKGSYFNAYRTDPDEVIPTIVASAAGRIIHYSSPHELSEEMLKLCSSFPLDYNFNGNDVKYIVGMSVPPVMTAQIAHQVYLQWFK